MCPIFVGFLNNFGRSDDDMIDIEKKLWVPLVASVISCTTCEKNLEMYLT